ncbi:phage tail tape measure protein [Rathayibacter sp. VKM Ac-2803]|uniref:phage tail tape measure protein n=1 Tax=Rathayibacter sp. VKM Ac-2803 TaxID=2609256 RepID=UPI001356E752|nr:phage tail tape measure protein [Rathayibacter sp. VKM Ac-2803]MWV50059.1 phage tail tape measure protein [Rathayibacter sp. VKM Ac-2803]
MPERITKISLLAQVSGYIDGVEKAAKATRDSSKDAEASLGRQRDAMQELGSTSLVFGGAVLAAVGGSVAKFAEFDQAMSEVQASTHETADNMGLLREAALDAGAETVFSATEAANAVDELSKAGVSTADVMGGALAGSLDLASAGGLGVADAAAIAATAMTQFNKEGSEVPHIADLLAAGAGKAQGSVEDLSQALNQGGLVASQAGFSIEETTGALAAFASAGLLGSDAGTSLKTAILALQNPSAKSRGIMDEYGISVYDAQGKMLGMSEIAGQLETKLGGLTDENRNAALAQIFGNDAVRAANVLYAQGADGIQDWIDKTNDSGYAAETAEMKLDNLNGDIEALGGSFDTALIKTGSFANDGLRFLTQTVTDLVSGFADAPDVVQGLTLGLGLLVGGLALTGGAFLTLVPKIAATKVALQELDITGRGVAKTVGKGGLVAVALAALTTGLAQSTTESQLTTAALAEVDAAFRVGGPDEFLDQIDLMQGGSEELRQTLTQLYSGNFFASGRPWQGVAAAIDGVTQGVTNLSAGFKDNAAKFSAYGRSLADMAKTDLAQASRKFTELSDAAGGDEKAVRDLLEAFPDYKAALIDLAASQGKTLTDQELYNLALGKGDLAAQAARDSAAQLAATTSGELSEGMQQAAALSEEAEKALQDWREEMVKADQSFFSIVGAMDSVVTKQQEWAQSTADSTDDAGDSWEDYYDGVSFSMDAYLTDLQEQIDAQTNWEANILSLAGRVSKGTLDELAKLGTDGAPLVAELVDASEEELARFEELFAAGASDGAAAFTGALEIAAPVVAAAGEQLGQATANEIARKLADGTSTVQEIIAEYGLIVESENPSLNIDTSTAEGKVAALRERLLALGNISVTPNISPNGAAYSDSREGRADGGTIYGPGTASSDTAGVYALSVGEEIISNKKGQADRNRSLLKAVNAGASIEQLRGVLAGAFADGGTATRHSADPYDASAWARAYPSQDRAYVRGAGAGGSGSAAIVREGPSVNVTQHIHPQPRQSEREIGQAASDWTTIRLRGLL